MFEPTPKTISGGYSLVKAIIPLNVIGLYSKKLIGFLEFRTIFALLYMMSIRFATNCSTSQCPANYSISELAKLLDTHKESSVRSAIATLKRVGILLEFSQTEIIFNLAPLEHSQDTIESANRTAQGLYRNALRQVPFPRRVLRFLAQTQLHGFASSLVLYIVRCFSIDRKGNIKAKGCVKSSWISACGKVGTSTAEKARQRMIQWEWLKPDTNSTRRKQNRTGAYCDFNLARIGIIPPKTDPLPPPLLPPAFSQEEQDTLNDLRDLTSQSKGNLREPYKDINLPSESKNQNLDLIPPALLPTLGKKSGVCKQTDKPSIHNVVAPDLKHLDRLETLYIDAVKRNIIPHTPLSKIDFVAAAIRARAVEADGKGNAVRIFSGIVRKKLNHVISNAQEDLARTWILKERGAVALFAEDLPDMRTRNPLEASQKGDRCPGTPLLNEQKTTQKPRMGLSARKTLSVSPVRLVRSPVPPAEAEERQPCRLSELLKAKVRENRAKAQEKAEEIWDNQPQDLVSKISQAAWQQVRAERQQMNTG